MNYACAVAATVVFSAAFSWTWHRVAAHTDILRPVGDTHHQHHTAGIDHQAHEDFIWVLVVMIALGALLACGWNLGLCSGNLAVTVMLTAVSVFVWEWYIHSAYHTSGHWLERFEWFQKDRLDHFVHHIFPDKNYGISTHIFDVAMGTYRPFK